MEFQTFITAHLNEVIAEDEATAKAVYEALRRFMAKDWGLVPDEDKEANNADLEARQGHVLGRYHCPGEDIYINLTFDEPGTGDSALIMYRSEY